VATAFFALATVFWFHKYYGFGDSHLWSTVYPLPACTKESMQLPSLKAKLGPGWPSTAYFQISPKSINELTILEISKDNDTNLWLNSLDLGDVWLRLFGENTDTNKFVFGSTASAELAISSGLGDTLSPSWGIHEYNVSFKSHCLPEVASVIEQIGDTMMIASFTLKKVSGSNNLFEGTLSGKLKEQQSKDISVLVSLFKAQPQFKHPFNTATVSGSDESAISFDSQPLMVLRSTIEKDIQLISTGNPRHSRKSSLDFEVPVDNDGQWHETLSLTMKTDDKLLDKIENAPELPDEVKIIVGLQVIPPPPK